MKKIGNTGYTTFGDIYNDPELISNAEREQINFQVELIGQIVEAREEKGITQQQLAEMAGVEQSAVARLESMKATPQIDTLFKILEPLGYTLVIKPKEELFR